MTYSEKLKSPKWQKKRLEVLNRDDFTCTLCGDTESTLHIHHKSYKKNTEPWDYELDNFQTLCEVCHDISTGLNKINETVLSIERKIDLGTNDFCYYAFSRFQYGIGVHLYVKSNGKLRYVVGFNEKVITGIYEHFKKLKVDNVEVLSII